MSDIQQHIDEIVNNHKVVLFMKGTRMFPQCGFSARAVEIFKRCGVPIKDVNVLSDPAIRQGIKDYSNWPTIPQVYVNGKFVGGSDILLEMYESGELQQLLGVEAKSPDKPAAAPSLTITERAAREFEKALKEMDDEVLRFDVSPSLDYDLYFGEKRPDDLVVTSSGVEVRLSPASAARADGSTIDYVDGPGGAGFKITPGSAAGAARVKNLAPEELKKLLDTGREVHLIDVRTEAERQLATLPGAQPFEPERVAALAEDATIVVFCHHGIRSRAAAEQLVAEGYTDVHNLTGGIDAWSQSVDPSVPRY